jgi:uncharacterized GH25 family protein
MLLKKVLLNNNYLLIEIHNSVKRMARSGHSFWSFQPYNSYQVVHSYYHFGGIIVKLSIRLSIAALLVTVLIGSSASVFAHDGWSQTNAPIIAQGEVSYIDLLLGNHSDGHKSYRIAGQWSTDSSKVYVITPADQKVDITSTRYYTGEAATETEPATNNGFVATFSASAPGAYIISVEGDSIFKHGDIASRTLRSAKSYVAVSDLPTLERVRHLQGFSKSVSSDRAELIPLTNPTAIRPNDEVKVQLLLKGQPLADTEVSIIRRSNSTDQTLITDKDGIIAFTAGPADYYLLRAKPSSSERVEGEYDSMNYEATMTYIVQNGSVSLPQEKTASTPYVYMNGKLVASQEVSIKDGKTLADSDFIREHVNASFQDLGAVSLREAAEAVGATVEFMPAIGGTRSAVLIYTK